MNNNRQLWICWVVAIVSTAVAEVILLIYMTSRWKDCCMYSALDDGVQVDMGFVKDLLWWFYMNIILFFILIFGASWCLWRIVGSRPQSEEQKQKEVSYSDFCVDLNTSTLIYSGRVVKLPPRVASFLNALQDSENHMLSKDDFNRLFGETYYDGTDGSGAKIRSIKSKARKVLEETPFDVEKDADGNFRLILRK